MEEKITSEESKQASATKGSAYGANRRKAQAPAEEVHTAAKPNEVHVEEEKKEDIEPASTSQGKNSPNGVVDKDVAKKIADTVKDPEFLEHQF